MNNAGDATEDLREMRLKIIKNWIPYLGNSTSILVTQNQVEEVISKTPIFEGMTLSIKTLKSSKQYPYGFTYGILEMVPKVKH